ncbi:DUF7523 family protein [Halobacterium litoreum]|uniref:Uncharacterized protein n=1 Tax=Halobacterium litoreum TaxID=2039234 RepID=A0ABD5NB43_9EURY|nr:hypothetical protein [Halobacterium litoreum]UHH14694.1 hypothetical protein LT972_06755 [Halobacterium litoreum]
MSVAGETRAAVDDHPFLRRALRAGVVNHAAAARFVDVAGDEDAVAAAIRRYGEELPAFAAGDRSAHVSMQSGLGESEDGLLAVAGTGFAPGEGDLTALLASGDVDSRSLAFALERLHAAGVDPVAAGVAGETLAVVVTRRAAADALRIVEDAVVAVPRAGGD